MSSTHQTVRSVVASCPKTPAAMAALVAALTPILRREGGIELRPDNPEKALAYAARVNGGLHLPASFTAPAGQPSPASAPQTPAPVAPTAAPSADHVARVQVALAGSDSR
jgi:hypothetical protein